MKRMLKWELKKVYPRWKYLITGYLLLIGMYAILPNNKTIIENDYFQIFTTFAGIIMAGGMFYFMLFPYYNMMVDLQPIHFKIERLNDNPYLHRLLAKLGVNVISTGTALFIGEVGSIVLRRFTTAYTGYFSYETKLPWWVNWFEFAIVAPLVFLLVYFWVNRLSGRSHGIISFFITSIILECFLPSERAIWLQVLISMGLSFVLIWVLCQIMPKVHDPYEL
ncbi:hypothetical protein lbkm_1754 [Lachnospiraceae bacterium KM106-2]|nr:hypothetical protein lbkm_1754 [Lachnospiraceae bacterium KM106-2]